MFFNDVAEIADIASRTSSAVFVVPIDTEVSIKDAILIAPEEKSIITIDQIRTAIQRTSMKQQKDLYIIIRPADLMNDEAANAFLKNLEEPKDKVHFLLITDSPSKLLPTILSRTAIYILRQTWSLKDIPETSEKVKSLAKKLITAKGAELAQIAEEIGKAKPSPREYALEVLGLTIEMLYKTYLITKKPAYLTKISNFLTAYTNISKNGHIKLHLVADLC